MALSARTEPEMPEPTNPREREAVHVIDLGNTAASEEKHTDAIRYYEQALGMISDSPHWKDVTNELRLKLSTAYERWYRVVGDVEDLRKALVFAEGYLAGLPEAGVSPVRNTQREQANARVERLKKEIEARTNSGVTQKPAPVPVVKVKAPLTGDPSTSIKKPEQGSLLAKQQLRRQRMRTGVIVSGGLGWLGLLGMGGAYVMYATRYDRFFYLYNKRVQDPSSVSQSHLDKVNRHRDGWRVATLCSAGVAVLGFGTATVLLGLLAKSKKKKTMPPKLSFGTQSIRF